MTDVREMYIGDRVRAAAKVGGLTGELFAAAADEIERLRRLLAKCAEHAEDGLNGSPDYARDRLAQIRKVAAHG